MKIKLSLKLILLSIYIISCSHKKPDVELIKGKLEEKINKESKGLIKLVSISKTDGLDKKLAGVAMYELSYTYQIEILKDVFRCSYDSFEHKSFGNNFFVDDKKPVSNGFMQIYCTMFQKGVIIEITDKAGFYKSEKGWQTGKFNL